MFVKALRSKKIKYVGLDVTSDPISTWLQSLCVCIVCGSVYCALHVRMCVLCVYGSLYVL